MIKINNYCDVLSADLHEYYINKEYDKLLDFSEKNTEKILALWKNGSPEDQIIVDKVIKYEKSILEYFYASLIDKPELKVIFELGRFLGTVDIIDDMNFKLFINKKAELTYNQDVKEIKHLDKIIKILKKHGEINLIALRDYLGLDDVTFSETINKANFMNLIIISKIGKDECLRLTDWGRLVSSKIEKN